MRHGESAANAEGWLAGHRDVALTPAGVAQAEAAAATLAPISPARVVSSDLARAVHTAALAWGGRSPGVVAHAAVRERHLGEWEGRTIRSLRESGDMAALLSWERGPPGGESHQVLARRALGFLAAHDDGADTLLFGHGGWIRTVVGVLDGVPTGAIGAYKVGNTEVIERVVPRGRWQALLDAGLR